MSEYDSGRHRRDDAVDPQVRDDAYAYALDAVDPQERFTIEQRVSASDAVTREYFEDVVASVREAVALTASLDATPPPEWLRAAVLDEVGAAAADESGPGASPSDGTASLSETAAPAPVASLDDRRKRRWRMASVAAAAVLVVGIGGVVVSQQLGDGPIGTTTSAVLAADDVRTSSADVTGGGTATVRWSRSQDAAVVTLSGLAVPAPDRVFEMWLIGEDPAPRPVGLVDPDEAAAGSEFVLTELSDATTFAVSIEPETGSPAPTTDPIAAVTLDA